MKRWVAIGIGVLLMLWVPFLYWQLQTESAPPPAAPEPEPAPVAEAPAAPPAAPAPAPAPQPAAPPAQAPAPQPAAPAPAPGDPPTPAPGAEPPTQLGENLYKNIPVPSGGPVAQLKAAYAGSSRDAEAPAVEDSIRDQFGKDDVPTDMLRSVSCHKDACKVEVLWSQERVIPFMRLAMTWGQRFGMELGSEPGEKDSSGFIPLTVYFPRGKGPDQAPAQ